MRRKNRRLDEMITGTTNAAMKTSANTTGQFNRRQHLNTGTDDANPNPATTIGTSGG